MFRQVLYRPHESLLPTVDWRPPRASELPEWKNAKRVSIDLECKDPDLRKLGPGCRRVGNFVCGVGFAIEDGPEFYLPMRHEGGDNCEFDVWSYVQEQLREYRGMLVFNGGQYDLDWLCQPNGEGSPTTEINHDLLNYDRDIRDVQNADVLIWELHDQYNLDALCQRHGLPGKDETLLRQVASVYRADPKIDMWRFPARYVERYGRVDARRPLQVLRRQEKLIESEGIQSIWDLESKVTQICVKMRRRGMRIDLEKLSYIEHRSLEVEKEELDKVAHATGVRIKVGDVWKAEVLGHALKAAGYDVPKTDVKISKKTGREIGGDKDSVDKFFLKKCGQIGEWLLRARGWNKLRTTNAHQVRTFGVMHPGDGGFRAHCTFNQLRASDDKDEHDDSNGRGVRYGRFSSTDFNIQAQPVRDDEFGELWRSIYVANNDEEEWICSDWSQQEPRIGVHYAEKLGLTGAKEFADAYRANPALDVHQKLADISSIVRKIVKNFVNGRLYGMGDLKLCRSIDCPTEQRMIRGEMRDVPGPEGQAKIDQFDKFAPWIRGLVRAAAKQAERAGHVWTILRRKCHFQKLGGRYDKTHKAFSRVGQGGAADQMKATAVQADRDGIPLQASIHDEFDYSEKKNNRERARHLKHLQLTVVTFNVPMLVDLEYGPSWGELKKDKQ
jgi:DNA polymerase I-like protein with 3'-5' exonuclease and polymerase domains